MLIDLIAGARPNFVKIASIIKSLNKIDYVDINFRLIHTGQHYDKNMSDIFFKQLNIPEPDFNFNAGSGSHSEQTSKIMISYENLLKSSPSNLCIVVGDVNSTMACSIVAKKAHIKLAHIEAGIRSKDLKMPEEINRIVTDSITDFFFTTSRLASNNLLKLGVDKKSIFFVGNTMIDTLISLENKFKKPVFWEKANLEKNKYLVLTIHRPSNVDEESNLYSLINEILENTSNYKILYPVHPRVKKNLEKLNINNDRLILTEPIPYLEFNYLVKNSFAVITDSGGITEETTVLGIPCITLRNSTERPETVNIGTNELVGTDPKSIRLYLNKLFSGNWKKGKIPELWDGNASDRIVKIIINEILFV